MSGKEYNLRAVFSAVDKISGPMSKINKSLAGVRKAVGNVGSAGANLGQAFAPTIAVGAAVSAFAGKAVNDFLNVSGALQDMSDRLGWSAEKLQEWSYAAEKNGVSNEDLQASAEKLNKTIFAIASGKGGDAAKLFKKLGISVRDADGNIRSSIDILPELADALKKNENAVVRTAIATTAMGKSGGVMVGFLSQGSDKIREQQEEARKLGLILSDSEVAAADAFSDETLGKFQKQLRAVQMTIGSKLIPVLGPLVEKMSAWLNANHVQLADGIAKAATGLGNVLANTDWERVGFWMKTIFGTAMLAQVVSIGGDVATFGGAIGTLAVKMGAMTAITAVASTFQGLAATFMFVTGIALGPLLLAIGALAVAGYMLYKNWDGVIGGLKIIWNDFMTWLAPHVDWVAEKIGKVGAIFSGIGNFASGAFGSAPAAPEGAAPQGRGAGAGLLAGANKQQLNGEMVVKFENAPPGMRVAPGKTNIPGMDMNPDVGYRSAAYAL
jgi:hypothetical protein